MRILAGDIGGTTTRLAVFALDHGRLRTLHSEDFPSAVYADLDEVVSEFFARGASPCERACFGIAGPVEGRRICRGRSTPIGSSNGLPSIASP
jgi:glucokinase